MVVMVVGMVSDGDTVFVIEVCEWSDETQHANQFFSPHSI
jgi:hypothetical protein